MCQADDTAKGQGSSASPLQFGESADATLKRLGRVGGWAPGNYCCRCVNCQREFTGDKRAIFCLPCAVANLQQALGRETQRREQHQEDVDSLHWVLDENQVAKDGPLGKFSLVGRVLEFAKRHDAKRQLEERSDTASLRIDPEA